MKVAISLNAWGSSGENYVGASNCCPTSVSNSSELPSVNPGWNQTWGPGPCQKPPQNVNWATSARLLPGLEINPQYFSQVGTWPWFHFTVAATLAEIWLQFCFWVLVISCYDKYVDFAVLLPLSPPTYRLLIEQIFIALLQNNDKFYEIFTSFLLRPNEYWSHFKAECGRWKSG